MATSSSGRLKSRFYTVSKILQQFLFPFNIALLLMLGSMIGLRFRRLRLTGALLAGSFLMLTIPGMPIVADRMTMKLETDFPPQRTQEYRSASAIVVLGGTTAATQPPRLEAEEIGGARLLQAARLFRAGKAPRILLSGGGYYFLPDGSWRTEAEDMRDVLLSMGIPADRLHLDSRSRNTEENAVEAASLLPPAEFPSILLVTSAFHMRRAVAHFERQGYQVIPVPTSYLATDAPLGLRAFIPTPTGLVMSATAIKEFAGRQVYWLLGRL